MDLELRRDIRRPDDQSTLSSYLTSMDENKHEWWAYAARHRNVGQVSQNTQSNCQPRPYDNRSPASPYAQYSGRPNYQSYSNPAYGQYGGRQSYQFYNNPSPRPQYLSNQQAYTSPAPQYQTQYSSSRNVNQITGPPARLQITSGPAQNDASRFTFRQPFRPIQGNDRGGYQYQNRGGFGNNSYGLNN